MNESMSKLSHQDSNLPNIFYLQNPSRISTFNQPISHLLHHMSYYSASSTLRKQDQISSRYLNKDEQLNYRYVSKPENYSSRQERLQLSATSRNLAVNRQTALQQEQIADLERKIDLILMHNQKLESEKQRYRLLYDEIRAESSDRAFHSNTARFVSEENDFIIQKLRNQLEISSKTYEQKLNDAYESRKILKEQIQTLSKIIEQLNQQNKDLKLAIKQQSLKTQSLSFELKEQFIRQNAQLQNKLRDQFLIREIELKNQRKQVIEAYEKQIQDIKDLFEKERDQMQRAALQEIAKIRINFEDDKKALINRMDEQFAKRLEEVNKNHRQQIKKQQDKAIQYIQQNIQNVQSNDQQIKQEYEQQINRLKQTLQNRKRVINTLLAQKSQKQDEIPSYEASWLPQLIALKQQYRQLTNQYLHESQLLKLKLTQKFEIDVQSLKKIYEDKIQLMALHSQRMEDENTRLRNIYQKSLQNQIQTKKDFELQKSKLRNIIRKLGVQLHGIQEEFKINIEGIRDQNSALSNTMMKSMIEVKEKANFFSQENRKLRQAFEQHERQTNEEKKQCKQKVQYCEYNYEKLKKKYKNDVEELKQRIEIIQQESEQRESQLRDNLNKEHEMIHSVVQELRKDIQQLTLENQELKKKYHDTETTFKDKDDQINDLRSIVSQLQADIERLKLDLSMAGVNDKNHTDTINQWKNHYDASLNQLQQEKSILAQKLAQRDDQLAEIVKKYRILEEELSKVVKKLKQRSLMEQKVIEIGLDNNLVKNMSQLFGKANEQLHEEN